MKNTIHFRHFISGYLGICISAIVISIAGCAMITGSQDKKNISSCDDQAFDSNWRFIRADVPGAENPQFNDSAWRSLDVPHDWSIEDLPPVSNTAPELDSVKGKWRFNKGDNAEWKTPDFNDSDWQEVTLPNTWERHSNYTEDNVYGWFRRHIEIPSEYKGKDFDLLLGGIDDVDETWLNGQRIGQTGSFPPSYQSAYSSQRRYRVPALLVRGDGHDVLAVRVYDSAGEGGIYRGGTKSFRVGPFDTALSEGGMATGHVVGGIGWYRKHFTLNKSNKLVAIRFDGVYMNADFWINGQHLGNHPYGYTSFEFDLTPYLKSAGQENVLAVRVNNDGKNSRWYSGSGIYRHVWLSVHSPVHIPTWGVFVTTPEVSKEKAVVKITGEVRNAAGKESDAIVRVRVSDNQGKTVGTAESRLHLPVGQTSPAVQTVEVYSPELWSPDSPAMYSANVEVLVMGKTTDSISTPFGIRKIEVDAEQGFRLNGQMLKLKGGCMHHDNGPLGSAAIDRAEVRRVELMKANGFNAIRTSHNPPSPAFLDACDRLGVLVIDEAFDQWEEPKNPQDYHLYFKDWAQRDIASMVQRDRNHPSVVIWSIGNEIPEKFRRPDIAKHLREAVLTHDPSRPIISAICTDWGIVTQDWSQYSDPAFLSLDIAGYNYLPYKYESDHTRNTQRIMMGTESFPRDIFDYWSLVEKHPYVIGDFVWTSMDYLGESGIGNSALSNETVSWPWFNAWCGDIDVCGFKKPQSFYRDVVWALSPIEMAVHAPIPAGITERVSAWGWPNEVRSWNWAGQEGKPLQVSVYSRCQRVRLELNGKVIGEKPVSAQTKLTAKFDVSYAPGQLCAIGLTDGKPVAKTILKTTGAPKKLKLTADRNSIHADRNDLAYVTVEIVDADGNRVPDAQIPVHFSVDGVGQLAAQASSSPYDAASFLAPVRRTFEGRCLAILRPLGSPGKIQLYAEAEGLASSEITINVGN